MTTIGTFTKSSNGFTGTIRTLALDAVVTLVTAERTSDSAPHYRVHANGVEIGAAWKKVSKAERHYLQVTMDDPSFASTIYASLIQGESGNYALIWSRSKSE